MSKKQHKLDVIKKVKLLEFYQYYPEIAEAKEIVAIKRFGGIDGYFVPAEQYEEFLKFQQLVRSNQ